MGWRIAAYGLSLVLGIAGFMRVYDGWMGRGDPTIGWVLLFVAAAAYLYGRTGVRAVEHQQIKEGLRDRQNNPAKYRERDRQAAAERRRAHNDDD